ncbi:unnamed protein product [Urochloa humidicola]
MSSPDSGRRGREQHGDDGAAAMRPRRGQKHKHIYLVMDDWEMGYSIHKLDVDEFESDAGGGGNKLRRLPEPPALRIEAPADRSPAILASLGSKIFFITDRFSDEAPMLIYDTDTASLAVGPPATPALRPVGSIFFVPVDDKRLYAFNPRRGDHQRCSFEVLSSAPRDAEDEYRLSRRAVRWSVASVPAPIPLGKDEVVTAYAAHPDGRTIFVSARNRWGQPHGQRGEGGTWSFDTGSSAWAWHGEWQLPFQDQGHYVEELDAWVGLRRDGFLCSCSVPSRGGTAARPPDWKLGRKTMFREHDRGRRVGSPTGATLTYMGGSRFCLVEARQGLTVIDALSGEDGCVHHVTVFEVRYGKRGELETKAICPERSYLATKYCRAFSAQAFWI